MPDQKGRDRLLAWGLLLLGFGLSGLVLWFSPDHWNLSRVAFPWMFRVSVLSDLVGAAFVLGRKQGFG